MRRRLTRLTADSAPTLFLTLTCAPAKHADRESAFRAMGAALPRLFKRIRRAFPRERIEYLAVWEVTKAGWPHLHVVARGPYIPQRWLSHHWQQLTGAPIVDIRAVRGSRDAARYVAKYLTKALTAPPGVRRWRASRAFLLERMRPRRPAGDDIPTWRVHRLSTFQLLTRWARGESPLLFDDAANAATLNWNRCDPGALELAADYLAEHPPPPDTDPGNAALSALVALLWPPPWTPRSVAANTNA